MTEPEIEALRSRVTGLLELIVNCANPPPCRMCRQHADDLLAALEALVSQQAELTQENKRLQIARIGDSEIIGRWMCQAEKAEAQLARQSQALEPQGEHKP